MSQTKIDSKKKNLSESFLNACGGYSIAYFLGIIILPFSLDWIAKDPMTATIFVTLCFSSVSFVRVFVLRSIFSKLGYDDNIIRLAIMAYRRGASKVKSLEWSVNGKAPKTNQH